MFNDGKGTAINITPYIEESREYKDIEIQTIPFKGQDTFTQSSQLNHAEAQTTESISLSFAPNFLDTSSEAKVNFEEVLAFLRRVAPLVEDTIEQNLRTHAFNPYKFIGNFPPQLARRIYTLRMPASSLGILDLCWNATGTSLAVTFGEALHDEWCLHSSTLALWNLYRKNFDPLKPQFAFDVEGCISKVRFHPDLPSLLLMGKVNGELMLLDLHRDDGVVLDAIKSNIDCHTDTITALHWCKDAASGPYRYKFITAGLDGKILVWSFNEKNYKTKIIDGFVLLSMHLPPPMTPKKARLDLEIGVMAMGFSREDDSTFVVGIENGGVLQCSLDSEKPANYMLESDLVFKSPIILGHVPHPGGQVVAVEFSWFEPNLFLTGSSDGSINIYSTRSVSPLKTIRTASELRHVAWSPAHPLILGTVSTAGNLEFYNLSTPEPIPVSQTTIKDIASLRLSSKKDFAANLIYFNSKDEEMLATSTDARQVQVWRLSPELRSHKGSEREELANLRSRDAYRHSRIGPVSTKSIADYGELEVPLGDDKPPTPSPPPTPPNEPAPQTTAEPSSPDHSPPPPAPSEGESSPKKADKEGTPIPSIMHQYYQDRLAKAEAEDKETNEPRNPENTTWSHFLREFNKRYATNVNFACLKYDDKAKGTSPAASLNTEHAQTVFREYTRAFGEGEALNQLLSQLNKVKAAPRGREEESKNLGESSGSMN